MVPADSRFTRAAKGPLKKGGGVEFGVLGPLRVLVDGRPARLGGSRPRAVLGVLLAHAGEAVSAPGLIDQVWGDNPPPTVATALQVHIAALRKVVGERIVTTGSGYRLEADDTEIDARRFELAAARVRREDIVRRPREITEHLTDALSWWRGEPYADVKAGSSVEASRQRLTELRAAAQESRLEAALLLGRHTEAVSELAALVSTYPARERVAGLHMLALYRCGRLADAHDAFVRLRERLRDDLGIEPGEEVAALHGAITRRDPTLDVPSVIPTPASRFIGRRAELDRAGALLGRTRLLTVTGLGGIGKSRLAAELARETAGDHPDGALLVELASLPAGGAVAERLAAQLGLRADDETTLLGVLADHIGRSRLLLVLDNCEHVADGCARLITGLLAHCPGLRILATSREPLGVPGEVAVPLNGLALTATGDGLPDAMRLLVDRARAARPGFAVAASEHALAARLCRRLDGLPLAIELAAAQLRTRSLAEVSDRLDRRLDLADGRARGVVDRHRTMRAALDGSHRLLSPDEQVLFRRFAVFAGGCPAAVAERVGGAPHDVLARLVDRSLLTVEEHPEGTRLRMLELVREYARERLAAAGDGPDVRRRHATWCAELAESSVNYGGEQHATLLRVLDTEEPNLRAALEWCLADGEEPLLALRIASPLWWYWWMRGLMTDGLRWLRQALAGTDPAPTALRGSALRATAALSRNSSHYGEADALGRECLTVYQALGQVTGTISAYGGLCVTALARRDYPAAHRYGEESRDLAKQAGDRLRLASALNNIGLAYRCQGRLDEATKTFEDALVHWRAVGDLRGEAGSLGNLATIARLRGKPAESRRLCLEALRRYRDLDLTEGVLDMLAAIACLHAAEGKAAGALRLLELCRRECILLGAPVFIEDEAASHAAAREKAENALGDRAAAVLAEARTLRSATVADTLLAEAR